MSELISVVVPVYNMELLVERCMKTLLVQTYQNYEIILVDDGSTDNSSELCDRYAQQQPEKVRCVHKENGGLSSARNAGMAAAVGKYVIFPDPDDWVEPNYLEKLIEIQSAHPDALVCCGYWIEYKEKTVPGSADLNSYYWSGTEVFLHLVSAPAMNGFAWNKLYRTDIIHKCGLMFLDDVGTKEDLDFAFRYLKCVGEAYYAPSEKLYHYYQREGAATWAGFSLRKVAGIRTYEKMIVDGPDEVVFQTAVKSCISDSALNLLMMYYYDELSDPAVKKRLLSAVRGSLLSYLRCAQNGVGRKLQMLLCSVHPMWLYKLKRLL